jgi:WD repeat-containing protein 68
MQHPYPATKIMWIPDRVGDKPDLLGTTGDYMRLWQVGESGDVSLKCLLNNVTSPSALAP